MQKIENEMRRQIAAVLPSAMDIAIAAYQLYAEEKLSQKTPEFKAYQDACKVAIAHIQLLIDLAKWVDSEAELKDENLHETLQTLIENAQSEINNHDDSDNKEEKNE